MAELVDAADLKSVDRKVVGFKSPSGTPWYEDAEEGVRVFIRGSLNAEEKEIYEELDDRRRSAFRICRGLAFYEDSKTKRGDFFLSCRDFGSRIGVSYKYASRLLNEFAIDFDIIKEEEREFWREGKRLVTSGCSSHLNNVNPIAHSEEILKDIKFRTRCCPLLFQVELRVSTICAP